MNYVWLKITKKYRNGEKTVNIPLLKSEVDSYSNKNSCFEDKAEDWGDRNPEGQVYGYILTWEEQTDADTIKIETQHLLNETKVSIEILQNSLKLMEADLKHFESNPV